MTTYPAQNGKNSLLVVHFKVLSAQKVTASYLWSRSIGDFGRLGGDFRRGDLRRGGVGGDFGRRIGDFDLDLARRTGDFDFLLGGDLDFRLGGDFDLRRIGDLVLDFRCLRSGRRLSGRRSCDLL